LVNADLFSELFSGVQDRAAVHPRPSAPATAPALPSAVTHKTVRTAIANALETVRAQECIQFGLEPERDDEDSPWKGKWRYVERRLRHRELPELLELAAKVQAVHESAEIAHLFGMAAADGVAGELNNPHRPLTAAEVKRHHGLPPIRQMQRGRADRGSAPAALPPTRLSPDHIGGAQG
jgi:hypothetical protein